MLHLNPGGEIWIHFILKNNLIGRMTDWGGGGTCCISRVVAFHGSYRSPEMQPALKCNK